MHNFKQLDIWKHAKEMALFIYQVTSTMPVDERFGLIQQMRRAAVSIPSNIAEGAGRGYDKDFSRFLGLAYGSSCELLTQIYISQDLKILPSEIAEELDIRINQLQKMIFKLQQKFRE